MSGGRTSVRSIASWLGCDWKFWRPSKIPTAYWPAAQANYWPCADWRCRLEVGKFAVVVYREQPKDGFIITAFLTRRMAALNRRTQLWP